MIHGKVMTNKNQQFLDFWKEGVLVAGEQFFKVSSSSVISATNKDQLAPNYEFIKESFGALSHGEKVMLALMYSFYDPECGQKFLVDAYAANFVDAFSLMDDKRKGILLGLLDNHTGW